MPNWVFNGLTVEGNPDSINKMKDQLNQPFKRLHEQWDVTTNTFMKKDTLYPNPVFAFWNIIKPTDMEAYEKQADSSIPFAEQMKFQTNDWYSFNVREWGTKWDVAVSADDKYPDTNFEEADNGDNKVIHYNFQTAWSPVFPALEKLSAQYPDLLFTYSYQEEQGWGGECEFLNGIKISSMEYDSQCRDCDATDQMEYCENDCGEICGNCHWLGEADLEAVAECDDHKIYLDDKVPEYRKAN
jgi:hypothetical protein